MAKLANIANIANIAWQILLFVRESLATDKKVTPDLIRKQQFAMFASLTKPETYYQRTEKQAGKFPNNP